MEFCESLKHPTFSINTELSWIIPTNQKRRNRAKIIETKEWKRYKYPLGHYSIAPCPNKKEVISKIKELNSKLLDNYSETDFKDNEVSEFEYLLSILKFSIRFNL